MAQTPRVLNAKTDNISAGAIFVDRRTKWGNRNRMSCEADRQWVCEQHELDLANDVKLLRSLDELRGHDLVCHCRPKRCHADLLLRLANGSRDDRIEWWCNIKKRPVPKLGLTG